MLTLILFFNISCGKNSISSSNMSKGPVLTTSSNTQSSVYENEIPNEREIIRSSRESRFSTRSEQRNNTLFDSTVLSKTSLDNTNKEFVRRLATNYVELLKSTDDSANNEEIIKKEFESHDLLDILADVLFPYDYNNKLLKIAKKYIEIDYSSLADKLVKKLDNLDENTLYYLYNESGSFFSKNKNMADLKKAKEALLNMESISKKQFDDYSRIDAFRSIIHKNTNNKYIAVLEQKENELIESLQISSDDNNFDEKIMDFEFEEDDVDFEELE
jgi:hypothetical protein